MEKEEFLKKLEEYVKSSLKKDKSGHDYQHTKRVLRNALKIAKSYPQADQEVLIVSCWLHDIAFKGGFVKEHHLVGAKQARQILMDFDFPKDKAEKVIMAIEDHVGNISAPIRKNEELQIESKILRDADNIDALGEIGLQRAICFNTSVNRPRFKSKEDSFQDSLYGALKGMITWADKMLTPEGKKIGKRSIKPMKDYIKKIEEEQK